MRISIIPPTNVNAAKRIRSHSLWNKLINKAYLLLLSVCQFPEMPFVRLQDELARPSSTLAMSAKSCILRQLPSDQWNRLCEAYVDHGLYGLLDHVSSTETTRPLSAFAGIARLTLNCYHCAGRVYTFLRGLVFPQLQVS